MVSWWWVSAYGGIGSYLLYVLPRSFTHPPFLAGMREEQHKDPILTLTTFSCQGVQLQREIPRRPGQEKGLQWEWKLCSWSYRKAQVGLRARTNPMFFFNRRRPTGHTWRRLHTHLLAPARDLSYLLWHPVTSGMTNSYQWLCGYITVKDKVWGKQQMIKCLVLCGDNMMLSVMQAVKIKLCQKDEWADYKIFSGERQTPPLPPLLESYCQLFNSILLFWWKATLKFAWLS